MLFELSSWTARQLLPHLSIRPGHYEGPEAIPILESVSTEAEQFVRARLQTFDQAALRRHALTRWAQAAERVDRILRDPNSALDLSGHPQHIPHEQDASSARLLLELSVRVGGHGSRTPSVTDVQQLCTLTSYIDQTRRLLSFERRGVLIPVVDVDSSGGVRVDIQDPPLFRGQDFIAEREAVLARDLARNDEPLATELVRMYTGQRELPGELMGLDQAVLRAFDCSLTTLLRVLWYLLQMAHDEERQGRTIAITSRAALLLELQRQLSAGYQPRRDEVSRALQLITMDTASVSTTPFDPELARERAFRPASRPIVWLGSTDTRWSKILDGIAWVKPAVLGALEDWGVSITNCVWPFELARDDPAQKAVSVELDKLKNASRKGRAMSLEQLVADELRPRPGFHVRTNLKPAKRPLKVRNEIDVLAADDTRRIVWVISVKDPSLSLSARRIGNIRTEFFGRASRSQAAGPDEPHHQAKLHKMIEDVRGQATEAAIYCGARGTGTWEVRGAFVTRDLCPAAFDARLDPAIQFLRLATVADMIGGGAGAQGSMLETSKSRSAGMP